MTDSTAKDLIFQDKDGYLRLDGPKVFEKAVDGVFDTTKRALEDAGFSSKDLTYFIGHNANKRILDRVSRKMRKIGCDAETLSTIKYSGNTSTASIGLTLDKYIRDGTIHRGDLIALAGVGSGMGYETLIIRM